jgi:hypothetical protein
MKRTETPFLCLLATPIALIAAMTSAACGSAPMSTDGAGDETDVIASESAVTAEDGLADAYTVFKQIADVDHYDNNFIMGFGFHPGLSTEKLRGKSGNTPSGSVSLDLATKAIHASVLDAPANLALDLWFVKNVAGSGRTVKPETGDQLLKVGSFHSVSGELVLDANLGTNINFDLDMVVLTRHGQSPTASRLAVGSRTILEKRYFREKMGKTLDKVTGTRAQDVETTDALVQRGAELFFNETFGGNGRTCGTCHRAERNLTIDAQFIASLPSTDPLFVAETNPDLAALEDPKLLRQRALIRENADGFDDPAHKFVERSVPHTLALITTEGRLNSDGFRLGWGGDGAPGRGSMNEFAFGAIVQHFTKTLSRKPGVDFRIPTQEELDALEAFQLFSGRQNTPDLQSVVPREAGASNGKTLFFSNARCTFCHDVSPRLVNGNFDTGVAKLTPDLPLDNGFQSDGSFNVPPLIEAADTAPLFHNNAAADIEAAVGFYVSDTFRNSGAGLLIELTTAEQADVAAFLRVINAAENVREVKKRVDFVRTHRSSGNTSLLALAIADTNDAINVLSAKNLNVPAVAELQDVKQTLEIAQANADADRPSFMDHAVTTLDLVKSELFSANPNNQF